MMRAQAMHSGCTGPHACDHVGIWPSVAARARQPGPALRAPGAGLQLGGRHTPQQPVCAALQHQSPTQEYSTGHNTSSCIPAQLMPDIILGLRDTREHNPDGGTAANSSNSSSGTANRSSTSTRTSSSSSDSQCGGPDDPAAEAMVAFLQAYGLQPRDINKLLADCPELFCSTGARAPASSSSGSASSSSSSSCGPGARPRAGAAPACCGDVFQVGRTLRLFHSLGWSHGQVLARIVVYYPQILTKQVDRDILPVLSHLASLGCSEQDVRLLVWENPRIFVSSRDWRRHVRKFQHLGLYGLPPPSSSGSSAAGACGQHSADSLHSRLMHFLQ